MGMFAFASGASPSNTFTRIEVRPASFSRNTLLLAWGNGVFLSVMALDMTGGSLAQVEIDRQGGLTDDDIKTQKEIVDSLNIQ